MPTISKRGTNAHTSPIRKLSPYAEAAKKAGRHVFHLNIGQPDIRTPQGALQQIRETDIKVLEYSPSNGLRSYREKLPLYYKHNGITVQPDNILITSGASEGIFFTLLACMDRGESVLSPEPMYANYVGFAEMADVHVKPVTCTIETGFALPSIDDFVRAITPDVKAILLCNPNNPTGAVYPESMLYAIARLARERNLYLLVDEVYREFCYGETPFFSALNLSGFEQNVVVFDSISKRYSACGARVGAIVSRNLEVLTTVQKYAETRLSPPSFGQMLAEALIDTDETYFQTVRAEYQSRRDLLYYRLSKIPGVTCYCPDGAFYVFARLPIDDCERFCQWLLEDFSVDNKTVMLAPGKGFYATPGLGIREVRFAYVLNETDLNQAMDCLEIALAQYQALHALEGKAVQVEI
jgi:aspartate aminotransferase